MKIGVNVHLASRSTLDLAVQAGCTYVRIDAPWPMVQPYRNEWAWALLDDSVEGARERNLEVLVTLNGVPPWANGGRERNIPAIEVTDWVLYVKAIVERYRSHLAAIEIWNEANIYGYWAGTAEQYVQYLLKPAAGVIRQIAPEIKICGPALSMEGKWPAWLETVLKAGGDALDVVSTHCYQKDGKAIWQALCETPKWWVVWKDPCLQDVLRDVGMSHRPVYLTECGWNSAKVTEAQQADAVDQLLERWQTQPWVQKVYLYQLIDERHPVWWGLFHEDRSPKPVVQVIQKRQGGVG